MYMYHFSSFALAQQLDAVTNNNNLNNNNNKDILNPEVQRNDFNVYRSSTFGQASITKAGTSWKWEERSQGPFHGLASGKQNFIVCF